MKITTFVLALAVGVVAVLVTSLSAQKNPPIKLENDVFETTKILMRCARRTGTAFDDAFKVARKVQNQEMVTRMEACLAMCHMIHMKLAPPKAYGDKFRNYKFNGTTWRLLRCPRF